MAHHTLEAKQPDPDRNPGHLTYQHGEMTVHVFEHEDGHCTVFTGALGDFATRELAELGIWELLQSSKRWCTAPGCLNKSGGCAGCGVSRGVCEARSSRCCVRCDHTGTLCGPHAVQERRQRGCDHKFVNSKHCLKCGWSP